MKRTLFSLTLTLAFTVAFAALVWANVPAPPANQQLGIDDGVFNNLIEADCRLCHEDPLIVDPGSIPDRHHLLMGGTLGDPNSAPFGNPGETIDCFSCHDVDCSSGVCDVNVYRDCLFCHNQIAGDASIHHLTAPALARNCVQCHGDLVNNYNDGHTIPTYDPSLVTPMPSGGGGPANSEGNGRGACNYCHSTGTGTSDPGTDTATGTLVYRNSTTHHNAGFGLDVAFCLWCHDVVPPLPDAAAMRKCEECHGFETLHNIQVDSNPNECLVSGDPCTDDADCPVGETCGGISPENEDPGWGHIGSSTDCEGCHMGYTTTAATGMGPVVPYISSSDTAVMVAGTDKVVNLTGSAFTNVITMGGMVVYTHTSDVNLTAADGSSITLAPDSISEDSMSVTIPGSLAVGNYDLHAVKAGGTENEKMSNPVVISIVPDVIITDVNCDKKKGVLTITGSGFGEKIEGTDAYISVEVNGDPVEIISWTDTQIKASVSRCSRRITVTVNALYGSDTSGDGKPPKPCKGKGCNK